MLSGAPIGCCCVGTDGRATFRGILGEAHGMKYAERVTISKCECCENISVFLCDAKGKPIAAATVSPGQLAEGEKLAMASPEMAFTISADEIPDGESARVH